MKDPQGDPAYGRTNWRRFAVAVGVPTVVAGRPGHRAGQRRARRQLRVSGTQFKLSADVLDGHGFTQYSDQLKTGDGTTDPGRHVRASRARTSQACASRSRPVRSSLRIEAGPDDQHKPVHGRQPADRHVRAERRRDVHQDINIGQDASTLDADGADHGAARRLRPAGQVSLHQQPAAEGVLHQASTFMLKGMTLQLFIVRLPARNASPVSQCSWARGDLREPSSPRALFLVCAHRRSLEV